MSFSYIFDKIFDLLDIIAGFGDIIFRIFFSALEDTEVGAMLPDVLLDQIGHWSIVSIMFGAGLIFFLAYTLIKWLVGIVT